MRIAYVGCRTTRERNARGKGLKVYAIDRQGTWQQIQLLDEENPSYQCLDCTGRYLYSVHGDGYGVSAYAINRTDGSLQRINRVKVEGRNPVFASVDLQNRHVFVATLQGGSVHVLPRREDGGLETPAHSYRAPGKSDDAVSHIHQCLLSRDGRYLFAPAQGRVVGFAEVNVLRPQPDGSLELTQCWRAREYSEPRHVAIHPNDRWVYLVNEKDNTIVYFHFDQEEGMLDPKQILPVLPDTYTGSGQASAMLVSLDGRHALVSNRIHESISVFRIDPQTGYLYPLDNLHCLGRTPRFMCFSPEGDQLLVANEDSDTIRIFDYDIENGRLTYADQTIPTESPTCITFLDL